MRKLTLLLIFCIASAAVSAEPLRVFASVVPIQVFVEKVGGRFVDARVMVRPGYSPHSYDPTPRQIGALAAAGLYVRAGVPFERAWMARIRSANPSMQVLDARAGIALREVAAHVHAGPGDGAAHPDEPPREQDPHVWTSPPLVKHMVGRIRDRLTELMPAHAADFAANHDAYVAALDALDGELHGLLDPLPNRKFMVFHPAWGYFADTYGLTQVAIETDGKQPGPRALATLIERAKLDHIKVVFVQSQFDQRQARQVARAIGGTLIAVDPLAADYVDNLRRVGREFAEALRP